MKSLSRQPISPDKGPNKVELRSKLMELKYLAGQIFDFSTKQINQQSLAACKELRITPNDLLEKNLDYFKSQPDLELSPGQVIPDDIAKLRLTNYEQRRRNKMRFIVEYLNSSRQNQHGTKSPEANTNSVRGSPQMNKRNEQFYQTEVQKDHRRFEQFKRVSTNMEQNAIEELQRIEKIKQEIKKKEAKAFKQKLRSKTEREENRQNNSAKFQEAIQRRVAIEKEFENQSMMDFAENLNDIKARKENKNLHERVQSAQYYTTLKQKHESMTHKNGQNSQHELLVGNLPKNLQHDNVFKGRAASSFVVSPVQDGQIYENSGRKHSGALEAINGSKGGRRPMSSNPALLRKPKSKEEYESDFALQKFNLKMLAAMIRIDETNKMRNREANEEAKKRAEILERRREQQQTNEHSTLQNYVQHNRNILKSQRKQREVFNEMKQFIQTEMKTKTATIENNKKSQINEDQTKIKMIEIQLQEKEHAAQTARQQMLTGARYKRELRLLQHVEVAEKRYLAKQLSFVEKRQLIEKQQQIKENYNDLQMLQHNLQQIRITNELKRQDLVTQRDQQVKIAKNNYLNQNEIEEKKKKARIAGQV